MKLIDGALHKNSWSNVSRQQFAQHGQTKRVYRQALNFKKYALCLRDQLVFREDRPSNPNRLDQIS